MRRRGACSLLRPSTKPAAPAAALAAAATTAVPVLPISGWLVVVLLVVAVAVHELLCSAVLCDHSERRRKSRLSRGDEERAREKPRSQAYCCECAARHRHTPTRRVRVGGTTQGVLINRSVGRLNDCRNDDGRNALRAAFRIEERRPRSGVIDRHPPVEKKNETAGSGGMPRESGSSLSEWSSVVPVLLKFSNPISQTQSPCGRSRQQEAHTPTHSLRPHHHDSLPLSSVVPTPAKRAATVRSDSLHLRLRLECSSAYRA